MDKNMSTYYDGKYNKYIGARYVPIFDGIWDNTKKYEPLTIVTYNGNSYTSKTFVPEGIDISNETYWVITGNYNAQIESYRKEVENLANYAKIHGISVKDYGAKGDGTTDDSEAFQMWLNYIIKNGEIGFIPAGTYRIASGGIQYSQTNSKWKIYGESKETTILSFITSEKLQTYPNCIDIRNTTYAEICGFTIECHGDTQQTSGYGLNIVKSNCIYVHDIDITNSTRCAIQIYTPDYLAGDRCDNIIMRNIRCFGKDNTYLSGGVKIYPMGLIAADVTNSIFESIDVYDMNWYGLELKNYCKNTHFYNCNTYRCVTACHLGGELKEKDTYGVSECSYNNINCYDTSGCIVSSSGFNVAFNNINCFYSDNYNLREQTSRQYVISIANSIITVSGNVFNANNLVPSIIRLQEGVINTNIFLNNVTVADSFVGRLILTNVQTSSGCIYIQNTNIQTVIRTDYNDGMSIITPYAQFIQKNVKEMYGYCSPLNTNKTISGNALRLGYDSQNNIIEEYFGTGTNNLRIDYNNTNSPIIQFRFTDSNGTVIWKLDKTGLHKA